ncbi:MAG: hypothetical protein R2794_04015 [Chitinophagales bacterium]
MLYKGFLSCFILSLLISCAPHSGEKSSSDANNNTNEEDLPHIDNSFVTSIISLPSDLLFEMADYLDSLGFSYDTARARFVGYFPLEQAIPFGGTFFYRKTCRIIPFFISLMLPWDLTV